MNCKHSNTYNKYCIRIALTGILLILNVHFSNAQKLIILHEQNLEKPIGEKIGYLEDRDRQIAVKDILAGKLDHKFIQCHDEIPNWGWNDLSVWIKILIKNPSDNDREFYLESDYSFNNELNCYFLSEDGKIHSYLAGISNPFSTRQTKHRNPLFKIKLRGNETKAIYVKADSDGKALLLPLKLYNIEDYIEEDRSIQLIFGIYYGLALIICIINLFFLITTKNKTYLFYVIYVFFFTLIQSAYDGTAYQYQWQDMSWFHNRSIPFFGWIATLGVTYFAIHFLELKDRYPKWYRALKIFVYILYPTVVLLVLNKPFIVYGALIINLLAVGGFIPIFIVSIKSIRSGFTGAVHFTSAFVFLLLGLIIFTGANAGSISNDYLVMYGMKFGSAVEAIILSFSLAVRFKAMKDEKELAQLEQMKKLEEMNQLKDQLNIELEQKVKERTKELAEKNDEITASINYAKRIQEAILPPDSLINSIVPDSFIMYLPKDIVAGDFYWLEEQNGITFFAAADCTGHGVPGAMVSVVCNNALNRAVREFELSEPSKILDKVRGLVLETFEKSERSVKDGMDISLCAWDKKNNILQWAGANNPIYIVTEHSNNQLTNKLDESKTISPENSDTGTLVTIKGDKQPIGFTFNPTPFTNHNIKINPGDIIYLFSDGFADQFGGPKDKKLGYKKFRELLSKNSKLPLNKQKEKLQIYFNDWLGDNEQIDDVCVIGVKLK